MNQKDTFGRLIDIAIKEATRAPMIQRQTAKITPDSGILGDYRGNAHLRQVTILSRESWEQACSDIEASLAWTSRRANLLIEGFDLQDSDGAHIRIGNLIMEVTGETKPCERMDEAYPGLRAALTPQWRGGVTCKVLNAGEIAIGDQVEVKIEQS